MSNAYYNLGIAFRDMGDRERTLEHYTKAIELRPNDPDYRYALGNLYSDMGEYPSAVAEYDEAIRLGADVCQRAVQQGDCAAERGQSGRGAGGLRRGGAGSV